MTRLRDGMGVLLSLFVWLWGTTLTTRTFFRIPNFFLLFATCGLTASATPVKIEVRAHWLPNLLYQLDCVSELLEHCSEGAYQELWSKEFLRTPLDQEHFGRWKHLFEPYIRSVDLLKKSPNKTQGRAEKVDLQEKIRISGFKSQTTTEWAEKLDLVLTPRDRAEALKILRHFEKRFRFWWKRNAEASSQRMVRESIRLLRRADLSLLIERTRSFFKSVHPPEDSITFNFFFRPIPQDGKKGAFGQQIERYSVSEFLPNEPAKERLDVVIHELVHFFWDTASPSEFSITESRWLESRDPLSLPLFSLLNEAIATSIGNGWAGELLTSPKDWQKILETPNSFYNEPAIDQSAKVFFRFVRDWANKHKTFFDPEFEAGILAIANEKLKDLLGRPSTALRTLNLILDERVPRDFKDEVRKLFFVGSMNTSAGSWSEKLVSRVQNEIHTSALIVLPKESLKHAREFKLISPEFEREVRDGLGSRDSGLACTSRDGSMARVYWVIAPDIERARKQLGRLIEARSPFLGLLPDQPD